MYMFNIKEYRKNYYLTHAKEREQWLEKSKKHRKLYQHNYFLNHKDKIKKNNKVYRQNHKQQFYQYLKKYRLNIKKRNFQRLQYYQKHAKNKINSGQKWKLEEIKLLFNCNISDVNKSILLGRSVEAIQVKRHYELYKNKKILTSI